MTVDYQAMLLDPIYATLGVPARVTLADGVTQFDVTVIDKTSGVEAGDKDAKVDTVLPAACVRAAEWKTHGKRPVDFEGASIEFNGSRWEVDSYPKRPVPTGGQTGEILLILGHETEIEESDSSS